MTTHTMHTTHTTTHKTSPKRDPLVSWHYEVTDLFSGEANYSWVRRGTVRARTISGAIRVAKRREGIACRHKTEHYCDDARVDFTPGGWIACMFVSFADDE